MQIGFGVTHHQSAVMHAGLVVNLGGLVVYQTAALVKQSSPAALHQGTGVDPAEGAVLHGGMADSAERSAEAPRRIVVMPDDSGEARDAVAVVHYQSAEMPDGIVALPRKGRRTQPLIREAPVREARYLPP